ncbi:MAG: bifunctional demethylmenaquinone methyltransferase/2-methoxy-6-polyprenyl-1,4-benzoquinol methylase UbiE [Phycisphaerales bacterium]
MHPASTLPRADDPAAAAATDIAQSPSDLRWSDSSLADPHAQSDKPARVRAMFAAIARSYDLNNRLHSFGRDQAWRRFAVRAARLRPADEVLDCACGTGDLTRLFAAAGARRVVGLDFTAEMLDLARRKPTPPRAQAPISYIHGDALRLPFPNASFNVVSIAFGIRNVADPALALREFRRVLRPGGRLVVLEFDRPASPFLGALSDFYTRRVMPITASLISGDRTGAYRYLPRSVATFMTRGEFAAAMRTAGFSGVTSTPLTLGICVCHVGVA